MKGDSMQGLEAIHSQSLTCSLQLDGPSTDRTNIVLIMRISITIYRRARDMIKLCMIMHVLTLTYLA